MGCLSFSGGAVSSVRNHLQQRSPRPGSLASEEKGAHPGGGGGSGGSRPSHPTRRRWRWWWWRWRCGPPSQRGMAPSSVSRSSVRSWLLWAAPEPPPQRMLAATWIRGGKVLEAERLRAICSSLFVFSSREGGGKRREKERKGRKRRGPLLRCPPAAQERGGRRAFLRSDFEFHFRKMLPWTLQDASAYEAAIKPEDPSSVLKGWVKTEGKSRPSCLRPLHECHISHNKILPSFL